MMSDYGNYVKGEITITPARDGSYLIRQNWALKDGNSLPYRTMDEMACFTNYQDMLEFLMAAYSQANSPSHQPLNQTE